MQQKLLYERDGHRAFAIVLETGEEVMAALNQFIRDENVSAAQITAIGAFSRATLAFFDWETKDYESHDVEEQVEVASMIGDVALSPEGEPALHIHLVLGRRDLTALAGHLLSAEVRPTLEVILTETPAHLRKRTDPDSGLALIDLGGT